jgi:Uncharacterised nucleotidyltransferase
MERIRKLMQSDLNWDYLHRVANHNRVSPLLYWNLKRADQTDVPSDMWERLYSEYISNTKQNMHMLHELAELQEAFDKESIAALPYKGLMIATSLYENLGQRRMWDIDILLHKEDVLRAVNLLQSNGYVPLKPINGEQKKLLLERDCEYCLCSQKSGCTVELHWQILPPALGEVARSDYIWNHTIQTEMGGKVMNTLAPDMLALVVFLHAGVKHNWSELKWICDAARIIETGGIDWEKILQWAAGMKSDRAILIGMHLASALLGASLPEAAKKRIEHDATIPAAAGLALGRLLREDKGLPGYAQWRGYTRAVSNNSAVGGWRDYLRYLRAILTPEFGDRYHMPYQLRNFDFLLYPFRFWKLFSRWGKRMIRRPQH